MSAARSAGSCASGGGAGRRARPARLAVGAAAADLRPDRGRDRRRRRRVVRAHPRASSALLPPGDLRMALAALAGDEPDEPAWADLLQHRFGGTGALAGHPVGNLLLTGLLDRCARSGRGAGAASAELVGAVGRVLPMSPVPLDLVAEADRFDPDDPARTRRIRGQSSIAATPGRVRSRSGCCRPARRPAPRRSTRCARPTRRARPGLVVHQRHPASAAARAGPARSRRRARPSSSR